MPRKPNHPYDDRHLEVDPGVLNRLRLLVRSREQEHRRLAAGEMATLPHWTGGDRQQPSPN